MRSLIQYINEERMPEYLTVWESVKWKNNKNGNYDAMVKKVTEAINNALEKTKVVIIKNLEDLEAEREKEFNLNVAKAAERLANSYKRVMKYDEEKRKQWIEDKIAEITKYSKAHHNDSYWDKRKCYGMKQCPFIDKITTDISYDANKVEFAIRSDFRTRSGYSVMTLRSSVDEIAAEIVRKVSYDEYADHLQSINICSSPTIGKHFKLTYDIIYCFDEDFEKELDDSVQSYGDMVSAAYASGRYMGD